MWNFQKSKKMPNVELEGTGKRTNKSTTKVTLEGMAEGRATWFLDPSDSLTIKDDAPTAVTIEVLE